MPTYDTTSNLGPGNDLASAAGLNTSFAVFSGRGDDTVTGGNRDDLLNGAGGNDSLDGGAGNDIVEGGRDNDTLVGGAGDDVLDGGADIDLLIDNGGNDVLIGGRDADVFRFVVASNAGNTDYVTDFQTDGTLIDQIQLDLGGAAGDYEITFANLSLPQTSITEPVSTVMAGGMVVDLENDSYALDTRITVRNILTNAVEVIWVLDVELTAASLGDSVFIV